jgi:3-phytase
MVNRCRFWILSGAISLVTGCAGADLRHASSIVTEAWMGEETPGEIDSVAAWRGRDGKNLLLATAKVGHVVRVYDGDSGRFQRNIGRPGSGVGEFGRPNGIFIADDRAFVVERDNHRIQIIDMNDFSIIGTFGADVLRTPYGLWVWAQAPDSYRVYVTDSYYTPNAEVPPDAELGQRVKIFEVDITGDASNARHLASFGATAGPGVLKTVESIHGDPVHGRLLIADENAENHDIKVYSLDGRFLQTRIGHGLFGHEPEGIALIECPDDEGYWLVSDQHEEEQLFRLFDRRDLDPVAVFSPARVRMVDGVWFQPSFGTGQADAMLYTQHDDTAVAAFRWQTIAESLGLRVDCGLAASRH